MKKIIVTILAIFYLGASSGATVHIHYCMGELMGWGIADVETEECGNCGMKKGNSEDCCTDQLHKLTVKDSPKAAAVVYQFDSPAVEIPLVASGELFFNRLAEYKVFSDSSPRTPATPVFIRNCSFRI